MTRRGHLPQSFYSQLSIYVVVNVLLVIAAVAAEGARWWYWMIPIVWGIALAMYGAWLYWFDKTGEVSDELAAGQQAAHREKEDFKDWLEGIGEGADTTPYHP